MGNEGSRTTILDYERRVRALDNQLRTLDNQLKVLDRERRKLSALTHHLDAGFALIGPDRGVAWANSTYLDRYSPTHPPDRVTLGVPCHQALCRKASPCAQCPVDRVMAGNAVAHCELSLPLGDRFHPIYLSAVPVHAPDGSVEQTLVMLQDLSSLEILERSAAAVRNSERRFRSIFEQAGAMVSIRVDGSLLQVNSSFATMVGYTEAQLLRMHLPSFVNAKDRAEFERGLDDVRAGRGRVTEAEFRVMRRDGASVWCHGTSLWQLDDEGHPAYAVVLLQDISERKQAEQLLEQSQRRYEALVHSIDGIVWEANPRAFKFSFVSKQAERILGYPMRRWLAQPRFWRNQIHPDDLDRVVAALNEAVADGHGREVEYRMIAADGRTVWMRDSVSVGVDQDNEVRLRGLMVDITEKKQAEEALRQSEEQLRQSQKIEAVGRLAGGIAHDFNNLLTAMTGYGDLLLKRLGDDNPLRREATEIVKAAQRAADLTGQLLAFSRQQVLQPQLLDLRELVADTEMMLRRVIGEHVELGTRMGTPLGAVRADPGQMNQVLLNLVVNARDAMPSGGNITVELYDTELGPGDERRYPGVERGSYVVLAVSDEGTGMDDNTRSRLFEPFFTTKEQGKGTGLGLSTVYGIVKQSGGNILVETELGKGSAFRVFLPRVAEVVAEPLARAEVAEESVSGNESILLVEDDEAVRDLAREILEMNGYSVTEASNGAEALDVYRQADCAIDLLVTDLVMPRLGGRELARELSPMQPGIKVLFLSGYTDSIGLQQGLLDPGSFFLQKPFTPAQLTHKVRDVLDDG